jgi:hypothetical protein
VTLAGFFVLGKRSPLARIGTADLALSGLFAFSGTQTDNKFIPANENFCIVIKKADTLLRYRAPQR